MHARPRRPRPLADRTRPRETLASFCAAREHTEPRRHIKIDTATLAARVHKRGEWRASDVDLGRFVAVCAAVPPVLCAFDPAVARARKRVRARLEPAHALRESVLAAWTEHGAECADLLSDVCGRDGAVRVDFTNWTLDCARPCQIPVWRYMLSFLGCLGTQLPPHLELSARAAPAWTP